ncbi:hypothetical protein TNCV_2780881 [Trichonephila clavipes]|nr:hypothetical protein TNCV_2780881 [Trichonephila clavipes]
MALKQLFEITTISHSKDLTVVLHGIPYVLEDSLHGTYPSVSCTLSAHRQVFHLNASFFYSLGRRIVNDDFQQGLFSRNLPFSATYRKTVSSDLPQRK